MSNSFTTETFIEGSYQAPSFTNNFPGPFAPPPPCPNLAFLAGNPIVLPVAVPAAGGILTLQVTRRGDPQVNLLAADGGVSHALTATADDTDLTVDNTLDTADLTNLAAGTTVAFTLSGFSGAVPPDTYCYAFTQAVGGVATVVREGSFDVLAVGF